MERSLDVSTGGNERRKQLQNPEGQLGMVCLANMGSRTAGVPTIGALLVREVLGVLPAWDRHRLLIGIGMGRAVPVDHHLMGIMTPTDIQGICPVILQARRRLQDKRPGGHSRYPSLNLALPRPNALVTLMKGKMEIRNAAGATAEERVTGGAGSTDLERMVTLKRATGTNAAGTAATAATAREAEAKRAAKRATATASVTGAAAEGEEGVVTETAAKADTEGTEDVTERTKTGLLMVPKQNPAKAIRIRGRHTVAVAGISWSW